jgi:2-oxoisovalerate dehydrogenase E1 component
VKLRTLRSGSALHEVVLDESDWKSCPPHDLLWMLRLMLVIRRFEEALLGLKDKGLVNGPVHASVGQEATAAGVMTALRKTDRIAGTHRAHHQYLAKTLGFLLPEGFHPLKDEFTPEMDEAVRVLLSEVMGLADGCCGGRGGSMHLCNPEMGVIGTNAIVAGGVPHATGAAWADLMLKRDPVTVCFFGDGAVYQGVTHEACNLGALWKAPVIYFLENNHYAVATHRSEGCSAKRVCDVATAYGMDGYSVDGMNPLAVKIAIEGIIARRPEGSLPCLVEATTYRYLHHAGSLPGSAYGYRVKEEEAEWHAKDGIASFAARLKDLRVLSDDGMVKIEDHAKRSVGKAVDACVQSEGGVPVRIPADLWPDPAGVEEWLRDPVVAERGPFVEEPDLGCTLEIKYSDAIAAVTGRWLDKDPAVVVMGEEVANFGGGPYGATAGLPARFPGRIRNTPITESGFCGLACGAAMNGMHPVVELMFSSFGLVAADQLFNQIGQVMHIYGGRIRMPLVVRTRIAVGLGYGAQHSMDPVALFNLFPGWRIFAPTTAFDYIGLFNTAMDAGSPTLIVEHHEYYGRKFMIPEGNLDYRIRPGTARTRRAGRDVTVVSYGFGVSLALQAADRLAGEGINAEVIDLRSLDNAGIDYAAIGNSLAKTGVLAVVEQAPASNSLGPRIAAECQRRFFDRFDGPPSLVAGTDAPIPVSRKLELACMPGVDEVASALRRAARRETA